MNPTMTNADQEKFSALVVPISNTVTYTPTVTAGGDVELEIKIVVTDKTDQQTLANQNALSTSQLSSKLTTAAYQSVMDQVQDAVSEVASNSQVSAAFV